MAVRVIRYRSYANDNVFWGALAGDKVRPLGAAKDLGETLAEFLQGEGLALAKSINRSPEEELASVELLSPITAPCQIICQGKNYLDHLLETGTNPKNKGFNLLFTKADSCLAPANANVARPEGVRLLDYELELGLVIGKEISKPTVINENNLFEYVAGIVMANDISARDIQIPERQWFKGKSFRGFCPVGPCLLILEKSDFSQFYELNLELKVNGKLKQKANTKQMMHKPHDTLSEISKIFNLRVGDLLLTGTPGGVAMRVKAKSQWEEVLAAFQSEKKKFAQFIEEQSKSERYLKPGDLIESSIRSIDGSIDLGTQNLKIV